MHVGYMWFPNNRMHFGGGPYKKDYNIRGSILGSPYLGKLPCRSPAVLAGCKVPDLPSKDGSYCSMACN